MRKKITMLIASLLCCVGVVRAAVTDLPQMSTEGDIKWYTISNTRSTSGKYLYWTESGVKDANAKKLSSLFYFTGTAEECYIHNAATDLLFTGAGAWNETGVKCKISVTPYGDSTTGLAIEFSGTALNESNTDNGYTTWGAADAGSVFVIEEASVAQMAADYKTAAIAALDDQLKFLDIAAAKEAIEAVPANIDAFAAIDAEMNKLAELVAFRNGETNTGSVRYNSYLAVDMAKSKGNGIKPFDKAYAVWALKYAGGGSFYVYNVNQKVYLGNPDSRGQLTSAPGAAYTLNVVEGNKVELKFGNQVLHMNNHNADGTVSTGNALTNWGNDVASHWYVETDFAVHVEAYKISALTSLNEWKNLSVVFDAELIETAKTAINAINTTDYAKFAAIDAELKKVTDAVAAKMFTFQTIDISDAARVNVWIAANASTMKAYGADKDKQDYNAIWSLQHAGGTQFYLYNELNKVYLGAPVDANTAIVLTETPVAAYTLEMITDKGNNVVEMHCNGGTIHASNHSDDKLISYDGDEDASRWMVNIIDITKDIKELLATIEEGDYADVPELGQYATAGYEALVEAGKTAKTVEEVEAAIAAFKATLNIPVYFITSKHEGYAAGSAIYYDGEWKWKKANMYDKQMWMTIPGYTQADVPAVDAYDADGTSYAICDYLTGTKMRGKDVQIVKVAGWEGAYNLQYNANAESTDAAQHAKDNGQLVNWKPGTTDDAQASVWGVEYIGGTYDLNKLTDEHLSAFAELQSVYDANKNLKDITLSDKLGECSNNDAVVDALAAADVFFNLTLTELAATEISKIQEAKEAIVNGAKNITINLPEPGKYYRFSYDFGGEVGVKYVQALASNAPWKANAMVMTGDNGAASIFYYDGGDDANTSEDDKLRSYTTGQYVKETGDIRGLQTEGGKAMFTAGSVIGKLYIYAGASFHANKDGDIYFIDHCGSGHPDEHNFIVEEVTTLPVANDYQTLQEAVDMAGDGETITLYADITIEQAIAVNNKTVFLNLNGKTINGEGSISGIHCIINDADYKTKPYSMSANKEGVDITYNRTFGHTNWQVLYVPFAIPVANMSEFDVYSITGVDNNKNAVVVKKITEGTLKAHTHYLIKALETGNKAITVEGATLEAAPADGYNAKFGDYTFTGTYAPKAITAETEYVLTGGEWHRLDNSNQVLGAFRVYLTVANNAAPVLRIITRGEEDTTAIDNAEFYAQPSAVIYDLLGRRVEKMDKGIYIVNGRKVVVK